MATSIGNPQLRARRAAHKDIAGVLQNHFSLNEEEARSCAPVIYGTTQRQVPQIMEKGELKRLFLSHKDAGVSREDAKMHFKSLTHGTPPNSKVTLKRTVDLLEKKGVVVKCDVPSGEGFYLTRTFAESLGDVLRKHKLTIHEDYVE